MAQLKFSILIFSNWPGYWDIVNNIVITCWNCFWYWHSLLRLSKDINLLWFSLSLVNGIDMAYYDCKWYWHILFRLSAALVRHIDGMSGIDRSLLLLLMVLTKPVEIVNIIDEAYIDMVQCHWHLRFVILVLVKFFEISNCIDSRVLKITYGIDIPYWDCEWYSHIVFL